MGRRRAAPIYGQFFQCVHFAPLRYLGWLFDTSRCSSWPSYHSLLWRLGLHWSIESSSKASVKLCNGFTVLFPRMKHNHQALPYIVFDSSYDKWCPTTDMLVTNRYLDMWHDLIGSLLSRQLNNKLCFTSEVLILNFLSWLLVPLSWTSGKTRLDKSWDINKVSIFCNWFVLTKEGFSRILTNPLKWTQSFDSSRKQNVGYSCILCILSWSARRIDSKEGDNSSSIHRHNAFESNFSFIHDYLVRWSLWILEDLPNIH